MLLITFWGLIYKLALVYGDCDFGTLKPNDVDWNKVGVSVLTRFL